MLSWLLDDISLRQTLKAFACHSVSIIAYGLALLSISYPVFAVKGAFAYLKAATWQQLCVHVSSFSGFRLGYGTTHHHLPLSFSVRWVKTNCLGPLMYSSLTNDPKISKDTQKIPKVKKHWPPLSELHSGWIGANLGWSRRWRRFTLCADVLGRYLGRSVVASYSAGPSCIYSCSQLFTSACTGLWMTLGSLGGSHFLQGSIVNIFSTQTAFAALKDDGRAFVPFW